MNIDQIKRECNSNKSYIVGLKIVTFETAEMVMGSIRKDEMIFDISRFIVRENRIEMMLANSNATIAIYYFTQEDVFDDVVLTLKEYCKNKNIPLLDI